MFSNLEDSEFIVVCLLFITIWLWILYEIIKKAVSSAIRKEYELQNQYLGQQTKLLSELLKHQGVDNQRILDILDPKKVYFLHGQADKNDLKS